MTKETDNRSYVDEQKEVCQAALVLCSWKYLKLDPAVARELESELKKDGLHRLPRARMEINGQSSNPRHNRDDDGDNVNERRTLKRRLQARDQTMSMPTRRPDINVFRQANIRVNSPPRLPPIPALDGLIENCTIPYEKQLTESDTKDDQGRVTLNKKFVEDNILPQLLEHKEIPRKGIEVTTYDWEGRAYERMWFRLWGSKMYVLMGQWNDFVHDHTFIKHIDFITVWMFRHKEDNKLCFAITSRRDATATLPQRQIKSGNFYYW